MKFADWNIEELTGYKPITTFYMDFSIAEIDGVDGIKDTFDRCFREWKDNYKYLTEFVMTLNWKIWQHYDRNDDFAIAYNMLYEKANKYAIDNLKGDELKYFYKTTD